MSSIGENAKSDSLQNYDKLVDRIYDIHGHDQSTVDGVTSSDNRSMAIDSIKSIKDNVNLNKNDLWSLCPILLYQLAAPSSLERSGCVSSELVPDNFHHDIHVHHDDRTLGKNSGQLSETAKRREEKNFSNRRCQATPIYPNLAVGT